MNALMKQAQKMQDEMAKLQAELETREFVASAGGGAVKATVCGKVVKSLEISPEVVDPEDIEMLTDLILAAVNDALDSAETMAGQQMSAVTGGLNIPGLF